MMMKVKCDVSEMWSEIQAIRSMIGIRKHTKWGNYG